MHAFTETSLRAGPQRRITYDCARSSRYRYTVPMAPLFELGLRPARCLLSCARFVPGRRATARVQKRKSAVAIGVARWKRRESGCRACRIARGKPRLGRRSGAKEDGTCVIPIRGPRTLLPASVSNPWPAGTQSVKHVRLAWGYKSV